VPSTIGALRRALVLMLTAGVLVMHTTGAPTSEHLTLASATASMVMPFDQQHEAVSAPVQDGALRAGASRLPTHHHPAACGGGAVCRAALFHTGPFLIPESAAALKDNGGPSDDIRPLSPLIVGVAGPPPRRPQLQVWRC
jgi:hypothetical protein